MLFVLFFFLVKIRLEIIFRSVLDRKETFFSQTNSVFQSLKNRIFSKGVLVYVFVCSCVSGFSSSFICIN